MTMAGLKQALQQARNKLHAVWDREGRTEAEVLKASIEFDRLLNEYQRRLKKSGDLHQ